VNLANLLYNLREPELNIALFCALYIAQNEYKIILSNDGKEMRFQGVPVDSPLKLDGADRPATWGGSTGIWGGSTVSAPTAGSRGPGSSWGIF